MSEDKMHIYDSLFIGTSYNLLFLFFTSTYHLLFVIKARNNAEIIAYLEVITV